MFDFDKDIQNLYTQKVRNNLDDFPISSNYLYINKFDVLFISKSRNKYKIVASSSCGFEPVRHQSVFDILYFTEDIDVAISMFYSYLLRLINRNKNELHTA